MTFQEVKSDPRLLNAGELDMEPAHWAETGHVGQKENSITVTAAGNPRKPHNEEGMTIAGSSNAANGERASPSAHPRQNVKYFDYNFHAMKKGVSSALLDVALLMANASQLKSVYLQGPESDFYEAMMTLLILSILVQVVVGCILIWLSRININDADDEKHRQAEVLNNIVIISIFILTVINVFTSAIGISTPVKGDAPL